MLGSHWHEWDTTARLAIGAGGGPVCIWALLAMAFLSLTIGLIALAIAGAILAIDVMYTTPTAIAVARDGVTLDYFRRTRHFAPAAIVVTHDLPRGKLSITRRGRRRQCPVPLTAEAPRP